MDTVPLLPVSSLTLPALSDGGRSGGLKVDGGAPCLSDPLHFIPDRLVGGGLQVVAEGAGEPDLMTGLCSALRLLSG